jgi:hypothetical protein
VRLESKRIREEKEVKYERLGSEGESRVGGGVVAAKWVQGCATIVVGGKRPRGL